MRSFLLTTLNILAISTAFAQPATPVAPPATPPESAPATPVVAAPNLLADAVRSPQGWCSAPAIDAGGIFEQTVRHDYLWLDHPTLGAVSQLTQATAPLHQAFFERIAHDLRTIPGLSRRLQACISRFTQFRAAEMASSESDFVDSQLEAPSPCFASNDRQVGIFTHPQRPTRVGWVDQLRQTFVTSATSGEGRTAGLVCPPQSEAHVGGANAAIVGMQQTPLCYVNDADRDRAQAGVPAAPNAPGLPARPSHLGAPPLLLRALTHLILPDVLEEPRIERRQARGSRAWAISFRICSIQLDHPAMSYLSTAPGIEVCRTWRPGSPTAGVAVDQDSFLYNHFAVSIIGRLRGPNAALAGRSTAQAEAQLAQTVQADLNQNAVARFVDRSREAFCTDPSEQWLARFPQTGRTWGQFALRGLVQHPALERSPQTEANLFLPLVAPHSLLPGGREPSDSTSVNIRSIENATEAPVQAAVVRAQEVAAPVTGQSVGAEATSRPYDLSRFQQSMEDSGQLAPARPRTEQSVTPPARVTPLVQPSAEAPVGVVQTPVVPRPVYLIRGR